MVKPSEDSSPSHVPKGLTSLAMSSRDRVAPKALFSRFFESRMASTALAALLLIAGQRKSPIARTSCRRFVSSERCSPGSRTDVLMLALPVVLQAVHDLGLLISSSGWHLETLPDQPASTRLRLTLPALGARSHHLRMLRSKMEFPDRSVSSIDRTHIQRRDSASAAGTTEPQHPFVRLLRPPVLLLQ